MCSDSEKNMSAYADQNHAPSLTCVRLEWLKFNIYKTKSKNPSATASRSFPSLCIGFIALTPTFYRSWSVPVRAKLAKLSHLRNRLLQKDSSILL